MNQRLLPDKQVKTDQLLSVDDHRKNNGPIVIEMDCLKSKVSVLKNLQSNNSFVIKDCLSRNTLKLRKRVLELQNKKTCN